MHIPSQWGTSSEFGVSSYNSQLNELQSNPLNGALRQDIQHHDSQYSQEKL